MINFTSKELLEELLKRENERTGIISITPYEIMMKMIEKGWKENPLVGLSDPRIDRMWAYMGFKNFTDDQSYCAATLNACLKIAGYKTSRSIPVARSFEDYGEEIDVLTAKKGDIAVYKNIKSSWAGHTGFVDSVHDGAIVLAGANQSNKMCLKAFPISGATLQLSSIRRITEKEKIGGIDFKTLKEWGLV